jgi:hypothetical protein
MTENKKSKISECHKRCLFYQADKTACWYCEDWRRIKIKKEGEREE